MELPLRWDDIRRRKFGDRLPCSGFGHLKFEMPVRHSSGDVREAVGYKRGEFWAEDRKFGIIDVEMVFQVDNR